MKGTVVVVVYVHLPKENKLIKVKCYVCNGIFYIEPKYCEGEMFTLKREKHHVAPKYVKEKTIKGIHCAYCGSCLLDKGG